MGHGSKNKTVFKVSVEIILVIGWVSIHSTVGYLLGVLCLLLQLKSGTAREASCHPAFMHGH